MITVANRATPKPLPLEQQANALTSEGAAPEGWMPEPSPPARQATGPVTRPTMSLPHYSRGVPGVRKA
ncbi:hypothetical protein [Hydrogenophaga sp.]|uniref:hypothetical protein n=1 Tax=Hydrogenophaga sp. TaxID=1904254 RepID=UPI0025C6F34D|nr:hypothetical protein [Hydrogenophaga sp.]